MHALLIGNGIAAVTAARHLRRARPDARITMVSDEGATPYARTALMYVHMGALTRTQTALYPERFWRDNRIERIVDRAVALDPAARTVTLADGGPVTYDALLVATGSAPVIPPWPGATLDGVQGLYGWTDLDALERAAPDRPVVVGGGLIGVELAEMLRVRGRPVTFLVRESTYLPAVFTPDESALVADEIRRHGVDLRFGATVEAIEGEARVAGVRLADGATLDADWVGVGTGVAPRVDWLAAPSSRVSGSGLTVRRGVVVDARLRASADGVWAAGDCAELDAPPPGVPPTRPIWYTAREQGAVAGLGMAGADRAYAPGTYFNSARFFGLEWQVYGDAAPGAPGAVWTDGRRSVRLAAAADGRLAGVSALGVRLRAEAVIAMIDERLSVDAARGRLPSAVFDPEFARTLAPARWRPAA